MRSVSLSSFPFAALVSSAVALAACSSAAPTTESSPIIHPGETSSGGNGSSSGNNESSSGGSSSGTSSSGTSSGASSSGTTSSSSGSSSGAASGTTISADTTWATGTTISENTTIASGVTVTISPGAQITISGAVTITIDGTLLATTSTTHAALTGTSWTGLVISAGGTLTADSLDISGATTSIQSAGTGEYDHGTITGSTPFAVTAGSFTTKSSSIATPANAFTVSGGTFTASYLNDQLGAVGALTISGGTANITDSTFIGTPNADPPDMFVSTGLSSLTMLYDELGGRHCSYHFDAITSFDLENLYVHDSSYGFMMYGSATTSGTRVVKDSNFENMPWGISESGTNGAIAVSGCWFGSGVQQQLSDQEVTISTPATAALTNVGPRAQ